jgi:type IV pilus assembly protein PilN
VIRVNLLPQKRPQGGRARPKEGSQTWLFAILGVILVQIVVLVLLHKSKQDELSTINQGNRKIQLTIDDIKRQTANHEEIKAQLKELKDREEAIQRLQAARTGPTQVLLEISHILTPGRGPTTDRDKLEQLRQSDPAAVPNPNWDSRRLWLTNYVEAERAMKLAGLARDGEDVSEFLRRLTLSDYFYDVKLLPAQKTIDAVTKVELVRFELSAKVKY